MDEIFVTGIQFVEDEVENEIVEPVFETVTASTDICIGVVCDCDRLNVRKAPSRNAPVAAEIDVNTEVMIDPDNSTVGWYNICTASGIEGFCMKDFVKITK